MLKFFIKVFHLRSLYLLNMLMDQVDTLHHCMFEDIGLKFYGVPS